MNLELLKTTQSEVTIWSQENFGDQVSKVDGTVLGARCPLLGIVEEYGELLEAEERGDEIDALGDITIYLCDFAGRDGAQLGVILISNANPDTLLDPAMGLAIHIGRLCRAVLKRDQAIRGFDDPATYTEARDMALCGIMCYLDLYAANCIKIPLDDILGQVWAGDGVVSVSDRKWHQDPVAGAVPAVGTPHPDNDDDEEPPVVPKTVKKKTAAVKKKAKSKPAAKPADE